jgi:sulfatase maturation enzyme AslB (radical SAM superfamily)
MNSRYSVERFPDTTSNLALARRLFLNRLSECTRFPKYFEIETVHACNARCRMCTIHAWNRDKPSVMADSLFSKFADDVASQRDWIESICLNRDGEPTLDKRLPDRVAMLKDRGIRKVTLSTNGQLLDEEQAGALIEAGLDDIMISIDGITKEVFEGIRIGLDFHRVRENTLRLIRLRNEKRDAMNIRIRMVIQEANEHQVEAFLEYWKSKLNGSDDVYGMNCHTWGNQLANESEANVRRLADQPCVSPFSTMIVQSDGFVPLCGCDYNGAHCLGDFGTQTIQEIWRGEAYARLRERHATGRRNEVPMCRGCALWERKVHGQKKDNDRNGLETDET